MHNVQPKYCRNSDNISAVISPFKRLTFIAVIPSELHNVQTGDKMYLAKRKVQGRSFVSGYNQAEIERARLSIEILEQKVGALRAGDKNVVNDISMAHLGLVISIVGRYVSYFPKKSDDLMGVAQLKLVEAINNFATNGKDNKITPYITTCIHGALGVFTERDDRLIKLRSNDYKKAREKSLKENRPFNSVIGSFDSFEHVKKPIRNCVDDDVTQGLVEESEYSSMLQVEHDYTNIEANEAIMKCCPTRFHLLVCKKLMEGYSESDIAREIGQSRQKVNTIKKQILDKLTVELLLEEQYG